MKKSISLLFIIILFSCDQNADTSFFNNSVVWDVDQASTNGIYNGIEYINKAFDKYDIVAIGETHGLKQVTDFYIALVNNEDFRSKVDVIVFEFGNSLYQKELDDYIFSRTNDSLKIKKLWREHTSSLLASGDRTGVSRFLKEIRNSNFNANNQIGVLAAEPPIDWSKIKNNEDYFAFIGQRDRYYADKVITEVVQKNQKALLIMGSGHFSKLNGRNMNKPLLLIHKESNNNSVLISTMTTSEFPYEILPNVDKGALIETNSSIIRELKLGGGFIENVPLKNQTDALLFWAM